MNALNPAARLTRRAFLVRPAATAAALAVADRLFGAADDGSAKPNPALERLAAVALAEARKQGATYCDIRINRYRDQYTGYRLSPERGGTKTDEVPFVTDQSSFGFGVRVIARGQWGFAASPLVTAAEIARITREAVLVAKANSVLQAQPVRLAPTASYTDRWVSPHEKDPFAIPIEEKLDLLHSATLAIKKNSKVFAASGSLGFHAEDKYFASTEGSSIQQYIVQVYPELTATAVDFENGVSRDRSYQVQPLETGWEHVPALNFQENARRIAEEVVEHLSAPPVTAGRKDLVLLPSHLCLTIHESIGHPTELDRALGYEANFAGTSFLTVDKMGKFRIASEIVNIFGDRTTEHALGTVKYDDDGVRTTRFPIIEKGIFEHYQTIRDQAHLVGEKESRGCSYADSWSNVPFQRMPNVWLAPGTDDKTLDDLIAAVDDGVLVDGTGSYSIDHQRYNFQFGGDAFWEIKGGKKRGMISRVAYQSRTPDFWQSCDAIAGRSFWQLYGVPGDGKGEPEQNNAISHGCAPARFRKVNVLVTD